MIDCAPVVIAYELGLFDKYGVCVRLSREIGWASIRDRLLHRELHAAHAPATMAFAMRCGLGCLAVPCLSAVILAYNGSAITVSSELKKLGVVDAESFGQLVLRMRGRRKFRFAAVFQYSTQHDQLRSWFLAGGLDPEKDVEILLLPSPLVHRSLAAGHLDGYCAGEPWNSMAESEQAGWHVVAGSGTAPLQVEKVFLVLERFEREFPEVHLSMVAALREASRLCQRPEFRSECIRILARATYLDTPPEVLKRSLAQTASQPVGAIRFGADDLGRPTRERGHQVFDVLRRLGVPAECRSFRRDIIPKLFREDLYTRAAECLPFHPPAGAAQNAVPVIPSSVNPERFKAA